MVAGTASTLTYSMYPNSQCEGRRKEPATLPACYSWCDIWCGWWCRWCLLDKWKSLFQVARRGPVPSSFFFFFWLLHPLWPSMARTRTRSKSAKSEEVGAVAHGLLPTRLSRRAHPNHSPIVKSPPGRSPHTFCPLSLPSLIQTPPAKSSHTNRVLTTQHTRLFKSEYLYFAAHHRTTASHHYPAPSLPRKAHFGDLLDVFCALKSLCCSPLQLHSS